MMPTNTANPFIEHPATFRDHGARGIQYEFKFANGYGASVIQGPYTYGGTEGLWELAVIDSDGELCYSTPVTSDVLGWQSVDEIRAALTQIAELPAA